VMRLSRVWMREGGGGGWWAVDGGWWAVDGGWWAVDGGELVRRPSCAFVLCKAVRKVLS
jgi:hypothetical protein